MRVCRVVIVIIVRQTAHPGWQSPLFNPGVLGCVTLKLPGVYKSCPPVLVCSIYLLKTL